MCSLLRCAAPRLPPWFLTPEYGSVSDTIRDGALNAYRSLQYMPRDLICEREGGTTASVYEIDDGEKSSQNTMQLEILRLDAD